VGFSRISVARETIASRDIAFAMVIADGIPVSVGHHQLLQPVVAGIADPSHDHQMYLRKRSDELPIVRVATC
jgi:hypothetical protein